MKYKITILLVVVFTATACNKFIEVEPTKSLIGIEKVFDNDVTATSAVTGIYANMYANVNGFASGSVGSISALAAMSADELKEYSMDFELASYASNELLATNYKIGVLWTSLYSTIYAANSAMESLRASSALPPSTKNQLLGEVYFIRAFCFFYLTNLFGEVPLIINTDYEKNAVLTKSASSVVYEQIIKDLNESKSIIGVDYASNGRVRPNQATVNALLARVYLFSEKWDLAEEISTTLINDDRYELVALNDVFLSTSKEAIWQLMPEGIYLNANEGNLFILESAPGPGGQPYALTDELVESFESDDERLSNWVSNIEAEGVFYYYPYKYKILRGGSATTPDVPLTEYSMVFRIAEQWLIRSEARIQQNKISDGIDDLNEIRGRARGSNPGDLPPLTVPADKEAALLYVEQERKKELFTEWGHRWFDLKRTNRANTLLSAKPGWAPTDQLYPIPKPEIDRNPSFGGQNSGY